MSDQRLQNEIAHGKHLKKVWRGTLWYWETPAGQRRWDRRVKMLTAHIRPAMEVLEIGCGVGYFTQEIAKTKAKITAIDISPDLLEVAREKLSASQVTFRIENAYQMNFPGDTFDTIVGSSTLHHLDVDQALGEFFRVLKPGGSLYFTEPNMMNPQVFLERHTRFFGKLIEKSPNETAFFRRKLKNDFLKAGFKDIQIVPFDFLHPLTPNCLISVINRAGMILERIPLLREIAGSLAITACKPSS